MKYKGIIFDLDGVICHTDKYHYQAWKALADKLGIYFDEEINNRLRGVSRMESFEIILEKYDGDMQEEDKVRYAAEKNDLYRELLKNMTTEDLAPEVKAVLDELRSRGLLLAIGSSSRNAGFILERLGLSAGGLPFLADTFSDTGKSVYPAVSGGSGLCDLPYSLQYI